MGRFEFFLSMGPPPPNPLQVGSWTPRRHTLSLLVISVDSLSALAPQATGPPLQVGVDKGGVEGEAIPDGACVPGGLQSLLGKESGSMQSKQIVLVIRAGARGTLSSAGGIQAGSPGGEGGRVASETLQLLDALGWNSWKLTPSLHLYPLLVPQILQLQKLNWGA